MFENVMKDVRQFFGISPKKKKKPTVNTFFAPYQDKGAVNNKADSNPYFKNSKPFYGERKPDDFLSAFSNRLTKEIDDNNKKGKYSNVYGKKVKAVDTVEREYLRKEIHKKYVQNKDSVTQSEIDFYNGKTNEIKDKTYVDYQFRDDKVRENTRQQIYAKHQSDPNSVSQQEIDYYNGKVDRPFADTKDFTAEESEKYNRKNSNAQFLLNEVRKNKSKVKKGSTKLFGLLDYDGKIEKSSFENLAEFKNAYVSSVKEPGLSLRNDIAKAREQGKSTIVFKNGKDWSQATLDDAEKISKNVGAFTVNKALNLGGTFDNFLGDSIGQGLEAADSVANGVRGGFYQATQDGKLQLNDLIKDENYKRAGASFRDSLLQRKSRGVSDKNFIEGKDILVDNFKWDREAGKTKWAGFGIDVASGLVMPTSAGRTVALRGGKLLKDLTPELMAKMDDELYKRAGDLIQTELEKKIFEKGRSNLFSKKNVNYKGLADEFKGTASEEEIAIAIKKVSNVFNSPIQSDTQLRFLGQDVMDLGKVGDKFFYKNAFETAGKNSNMVNRFGRLENARVDSAMKKIDSNNEFSIKKQIDEFKQSEWPHQDRFPDTLRNERIIFDSTISGKKALADALLSNPTKYVNKEVRDKRILESLPLPEISSAELQKQIDEILAESKHIASMKKWGADLKDPKIDGLKDRTAELDDLIYGKKKALTKEKQNAAFTSQFERLITKNPQFTKDNTFFKPARPGFIDDLIDKVKPDSFREQYVFNQFEDLFKNKKIKDDDIFDFKGSDAAFYRKMNQAVMPKNIKLDDFAKTFDDKVIGRKLLNEFNNQNKTTRLNVDNPFFRKTDDILAKVTEPLMRKFDKTYGVDRALVEAARQETNNNNVIKNTLAEELKMAFKNTTVSERKLLTKAYEQGKITGIEKLDKIIPLIKTRLDEAKVMSGNEARYIEDYLPIIDTSKNKNLFQTRTAESNPLSTFNKYEQERFTDKIFDAVRSGREVETDTAKLVAKYYFDSSNIMTKKNIKDFAKQNNIKLEGDNERYLNELFTATRNEDLPVFLRALKGMNNTWKNAIMNMALFSSPAARNLYGGFINNFQSEVGVRDYAKALNQMTNKKAVHNFKDGTKMSQPSMVEAALKQAIDQGQFKGDFVDPSRDWDITVGKGQAFKKLLNPNESHALKIGGAVNGKIEELLRTANFMKGLDNYGTTKMGQDLAGQDVVKTHFNYNSQQMLTPFEQNLKDYIMPFYTFRRFNVPFQLEKQVMNPFRVNAVRSAERNLDEENEEDKKVRPITMNNTVKIADRYYSTSFNPQHDVTDLGGSSLLNMISPFLKAPVEASGVLENQLGTGMDLHAKGYLDLVPKNMREKLAHSDLGDKLGAEVNDKNGRLLVRNQALNPFMSMFPNVSRVNKAVGDIKEKDTPSKEFILKNFLGLSNYDENVFKGIDTSNFFSQLDKSAAGIDDLIREGKLTEEDRFNYQRDIKDRADNRVNSKTMDYQYGLANTFLNKALGKMESGKFGYFSKWGTKFDQYGNLVDYDPSKDKRKEVPYDEMMRRVAEGRQHSSHDAGRFAELFKKKQTGQFNLRDMYEMTGDKYPY